MSEISSLFLRNPVFKEHSKGNVQKTEGMETVKNIYTTYSTSNVYKLL